MILRKDCSGKTDSLFSCDRCKVLIGGKEKLTIRVFSGRAGKIIKKWDLCPLCYRKLYKGIEKYKKTE